MTATLSRPTQRIKHTRSQPNLQHSHTASNRDRSRLFARIDKAAITTGFDTAIAAADKLVAAGDDPASAGLEMLARRMVQGAEPSPAVVDLNVYDRLLNTGQEESA